jgi:hypothetical protein
MPEFTVTVAVEVVASITARNEEAAEEKASEIQGALSLTTIEDKSAAPWCRKAIREADINVEDFEVEEA